MDADASIVVAPRAIGDDEESFEARLASDGQGWGIAWRSFGRAHPGGALARLAPDGTPRGPIIRMGDADALRVGLAWVGDGWMAALATYDRPHDRSVIRLRWFDRSGRAVETRTLPPSPGESGDLHATARGASAWLTWADDAAFGLRHDPRVAAFEGRRTVAGPLALGPRRSGDAPVFACAATECTAAWVGIPEGGDAPAVLHVQVFDAQGAPRGAARRIGATAVPSRLGSVGLARSLDERETLAVWCVREGDGLGLMRVRLGADGAPLSPPARLPLP